MTLKQLKKKLEPWIRTIIREELRKTNKKGVYSDDEMDQVLKNAQKAMGFLGMFNKKDDKKDMDVEWEK